MVENSKKGLILVNTGNGKGKSTAAFGVVFRCLGRKMKCAVVQFIKGKWKTGERMYAETIPGLEFYEMGRGFTWESEDLDKDKKAAQIAWQKCKEFILNEEFDLLVMDEMTYAINYNFIQLSDVVETLKNKPKSKHIIITGRDCAREIIDIADLVTEMKLIKHPFEQGIKAQIGIEY